MRRLITERFYKTDDTPWAGLSISFKRIKSSYTSAAHYPVDQIEAFTDTDGNLYSSESSQGVYLWVNQEGDIPSAYTAYLPGCESFEFSVPTGDGSPISLSVLRQNYAIDSMTYNTLVNYVDTSISTHNLNSEAHPSLSSGKIRVNFAFGDASPKTIVSLPANTTVVTTQIIITETFNGVTPSLRLGDSTLSSRFFDIPSAGLTGLYELESNITHSYTATTDVLLTIDPGIGGSTGKGIVIVEI